MIINDSSIDVIINITGISKIFNISITFTDIKLFNCKFKLSIMIVLVSTILINETKFYFATPFIATEVVLCRNTSETETQ